MSIKIKVLVFISMLVLVFSTVACKQSGEADEAVSGAVEEVSIKVDDTVDNATEEVSIKVDDTVDNATDVLRW
jgi:uncharacterized protein YcnI